MDRVERIQAPHRLLAGGLGMRIGKNAACDFCDKRELPGDKFFDFCLPPSLSPLTGRPDSRFAGIASASNPKVLAQLLACPDCMLKARAVIKFTTRKMKTLTDTIIALQIESIGDLTKLPHGRVRRILEQIKRKRILLQ